MVEAFIIVGYIVTVVLAVLFTVIVVRALREERSQPSQPAELTPAQRARLDAVHHIESVMQTAEPQNTVKMGSSAKRDASTFRVHKLACLACDSPLSVQAGSRLASCDFCGSQYYLEGYKPQPMPERRERPYPLNNPYVVDGGVSIRAVSGPARYAQWLD